MVGDRDRRRVARRRRGGADRDAAPGAPRGGVPGLDGRQARLGEARSDALQPVLRAQSISARTCSRARASRTSRSVWPRPARCRPTRWSRTGSRRSARGSSCTTSSRFKLDGVADPYQTSTTRDGWLAARRRRPAGAQADQRLALRPRRQRRRHAARPGRPLPARRVRPVPAGDGRRRRSGDARARRSARRRRSARSRRASPAPTTRARRPP